ncbi:MerR family transcriptional regulator [Rhodopirellula bahusiensis]|uniref:Mercuric resistance operon regulatory protein n=3 Tax=Pirellulaceae TaxID=2691357 RepID=M5SEY4_9BACT|nr:MerR family DNA-binding protein [Rhodopirellula bahusiensis]EMI24729.1 transcriptional regulator, MerR family protein [Rhodopirellula europaea SH398]MAP09827.1 heavy metal-responsive transcriptional regulator [Rhodopirellula sp.]PHQ35231.1 heavy metal-responsive transcriptional regulator [Rhodopirellula bahusiensis]
MSRFTIGKVAEAAGVGVETVRFYQRRGLLAEPSPVRTLFREYPESTVDRIRFIRRAKDLGFTLAEIGELLALSEIPHESRGKVKQLAEQKLVAIRQKLVDLQQMETTLSGLVQDCSGRGSLDGCPIIEAMIHEPTKCDHRGN